MDHGLICRWLGLPAGSWPPDHYRLLGLPRGERDIGQIEQEVHERMNRVRCYQLSHPELATEAMNRLAQALVCLTDPRSKTSYDASLGLGDPVRPPVPEPALVVTRPSAPLPPRPPEPANKDLTPLPGVDSAPHVLIDWASARDAPPPSRQRTIVLAAEPPAPGPVNGTVAVPETAPRRPSGPTPILQSAPADPVFETARTSIEAKRGLGTKRALYHRLALTRQLYRAWDAAGKYLGQPRRRLRAGEDIELASLLTELAEILAEFPAFLGQPGQPGQHVAALVRQQAVVATFKMLDVHQRDALAKDWIAGRTLLASHRQFLRHELQALRKRTWWGRTVRAVRAALNDHPGYVIAAVGLVALLVALFHWAMGS
jgi:hypothetical protein